MRALTIAETAAGADDLHAAPRPRAARRRDRKLARGVGNPKRYTNARSRSRTARSAPAIRSSAAMRFQLARSISVRGASQGRGVAATGALTSSNGHSGRDHPTFVSGLITLGNLRDDAGDLERRRRLSGARWRSPGVDRRHRTASSIAELLNNLGEVYRQKQDYGRAEDLFAPLPGARRTRDWRRTATSLRRALQNLGIIARERKDYATAIATTCARCRSGSAWWVPGHPDVAHILTNPGQHRIARSVITRGRSRPIFGRCTSGSNAAGPYQQATLKSVGNIAKTCAAAGNVWRTPSHTSTATDAIVEKQLALNLAVGSGGKSSPSSRACPELHDRTISLAPRSASDDHGRAARSPRSFCSSERARAGRHDRRPSRRCGSGVVAPAGSAPLDRPARRDGELRAAHAQRRRAMQRREERRRDARTARGPTRSSSRPRSSDRSAEFRAQIAAGARSRPVQAAMPADAVLLGFMVFRPVRPDRPSGMRKRSGPPHYARVRRCRSTASPRGSRPRPSR